MHGIYAKQLSDEERAVVVRNEDLQLVADPGHPCAPDEVLQVMPLSSPSAMAARTRTVKRIWEGCWCTAHVDLALTK